MTRAAHDEAHCECGAWSGEACTWAGPRSDTVLIDYMPDHLRASHEAAGNRGRYPCNGSSRLRVSLACAAWMVGADGDWVDEVRS